MDGNNRWSQKNNTTKTLSYKKGVNKILTLSKFIFTEYKVPYVSAFALSSHNLNRSKNFISIIINTIKHFLIEYDKFDIDYKIKFIGDLSFINDSKIIADLKKIETNNSVSKFTLIVFINYSGTTELNNAAKLISKIKYKDFNLRSCLMTSDLPDPDILIRSGGFSRISDFMLYQLSFTELFFIKKLWPDFQKNDLKKIINNFLKLERKFGI